MTVTTPDTAAGLHAPPASAPRNTGRSGQFGDFKGSKRVTLAVALALLLGAGSAVLGYLNVMDIHAELRRLSEERSAAYQTLQSSLTLEVGARGYLIAGRADHLHDYHRALEQLRADWDGKLARMDAALVARGLPSLHEALNRSMELRARAIQMYESDGPEAARAVASRGSSLVSTEQVRVLVEAFVANVNERMNALGTNLAHRQLAVLVLIGAALLASIALMALSRRQADRRGAATVAALAETEAARDTLDRKGREIATLFRMDELLQSGGGGMEDISAVVAHTASRLLPGYGGALYVFNNSKDRMDLASAWAGDAAASIPDLDPHVTVTECWALKRGRAHSSGLDGDLPCGLACKGNDAPRGRLCLPMKARSEVFGVLQFHYNEDVTEAAPVPEDMLALTSALADSASLSLANLALRDRLKSQALRDPLTGLYNRRFLDEMLTSTKAQAQRRGTPVAAMMLDLDHFKKINDTYGHATGDAVLRAVAATIQGRMRLSDICCRYGGEEMLVLIPDCDPAGAMDRAEDLRRAIAGLHESDDSALPRVTVSIGVSAYPEHGASMTAVVRAADEALYAAKRGGRNRVVSAPSSGITAESPAEGVTLANVVAPLPVLATAAE